MSVYHFHTEAFRDQIYSRIATAVEHKNRALSLLGRAKTAKNLTAVMATRAANYRADKAVSAFEEAIKFDQDTQRAVASNQAGLVHIEMCERHLKRATTLIEQR